MRAPGPGLLEVGASLPLILRDRLRWVQGLHARYGDIVRVPLGHRAIHAVFHPEHLRHILVANAGNYCKGRTFEKTRSYLGKGLATAEGEVWKAQRRTMNPHFAGDALGGLRALMEAVVDRRLDALAVRAHLGETIDLAVELPRLAMETVARSLFGAAVPQDQVERIIDAYRIALEFAAESTLNPFDALAYLPLPRTRSFHRAVRFLDEVIGEMIAVERGREPSGTLLSALLRAPDPETGAAMSAAQLRDEVMTLFIGGTDTSGNTMGWFLYNLAKHPAVAAGVRDEVMKADGSVEQDPCRLAYTKRVVEETLRLFPQNWVGSRDAVADDSIGGSELPAGGTVFLGVYVVHRRPDFWERPESFEPDRFLPAHSAGRHPFAYLPFGGGHRKCIGYHFAMMEFLLTLPRLLHRFDVELLDVDGISAYPTWSLWARPGLRARLRERARGA